MHRAQVMGRCEDTTGIVPFGRLVEQVMTAEPYAGAERVFWVVDNGSSHRGHASIDRLGSSTSPFTPPGWTNAKSFSRSSSEKWNPKDFTDLDEITDRLAAFEKRYNHIAQPFDWTFGRDDLDKLLSRLHTHAARAA